MKYFRLVVLIISIGFINESFSQDTHSESEILTQLKNKGVRVRIESHSTGMLMVRINEKSKILDEDLKLLLPLVNKVSSFSVYKKNISKNILNLIKDMKNIESLGIGIGLSDGDLGFLINLKKIESIGLEDNKISGAGLANISELDSITSITLTGNPIKDEYLKFFENHKKLRTLNLNETPVSDKALDIIAKYKSRELVAVYVIGTKVTKKAAERFYKLRGVEACVNANDCHLQ